MRPVTYVHLDTDLGSDPDDACALVMVAGWADVSVTGITTVIDEGGYRAGCVQHYLDLLGRSGVPLAAGAGASMTTLASPVGTQDDDRYWPSPVPVRPSPPGAALDLLLASVRQGATVVAIGPVTNLALLAVACPGALRDVPVVAMGGWVRPPAEGLPQWGPERDWNVQCDTRAVEILLACGARLTFVTLPATLAAHLRSADLLRLRASGAAGGLLARQSEVHAAESGKAGLGPGHAALPDDLLNFHYDPVTCAVALGWPAAVTESVRVRPALREDGVLTLRPDPDGVLVDVVTEVDGGAFSQLWLAAVEAAQRRS